MKDEDVGVQLHDTGHLHGAGPYIEEVVRLFESVEVTNGDGSPVPREDGVSLAVRSLLNTGRAGNKVILVGNGGSASIAGHMQMDLCNSLGIRAQAFNDAPSLTALANDYGYVTAFERMVRLWAVEGDLITAISSSGQSENILRSVKAARAVGCRVLTCSGFRPDNPLRAMGDVNFYVGSSSYGMVEVIHSFLAHMFTDLAKAELVTGEER